MSLVGNKEGPLYDVIIVLIALTLHTIFNDVSRDFFTPFWKALFGEDKLLFSIYGISFSLYSILGSLTVFGVFIGILYGMNNKKKDKKKKKVEEIEIPHAEIEKMIEQKLKQNFIQNPRQPGESKNNGTELDMLLQNRQFQPIIPQDFYY